MQPRKKPRLAPIGAPDGFEKSPTQPRTKIAVPQFTSAFASSSTTAPKPRPKITASHASLDPRLKGASGSGEHAKVSSHHNVSVPSILAAPRLAICPDAVFNRPTDPFVAFKDLSHDRNTATVLQQVHEPHLAVLDIALKRLQAPQLAGLLLKENEEATTLKPIGSPPRLPVSGDARHLLQTISTTSIARVTDISTDSGNAELASILLYDQHPEIMEGEGGEARRGLNFSPRKKRYRNGDPQFVRGGLASRASQLLTRMHTSLALWQKEAERHALPSPDLRMTIVKIEHVPIVLSSTKSNSSSCFGIALCRIHVPTMFGQTDSSTFVASSHRCKLSKVVFSFPRHPAPTPAEGPSRNPSYFAANAEVHAWKPWHEVKLSSSWPLAAAVVGDAPMPASFPMPLTLTYVGCSPGLMNTAGCDLPLSDTVLLCHRFVFVCQSAAGA